MEMESKEIKKIEELRRPSESDSASSQSQSNSDNSDSESYSSDIDHVQKEEKNDISKLEPNNEPSQIKIPDHACKYCGIAEPSSVVKCRNCVKWFCNNMFGSCGSHIVQHLVKAKHKEVSLHPDSQLGDNILECYVCGSKSIFLLGFVTAKTDSVVILLCREPCISSKSINNTNWDLENWQPIIEEKCFLPWLVKPSQDLSIAHPLTQAEINKLEELWSTNPSAKIDSMNKTLPEDNIKHVQLKYKDSYEYTKIFKPLVKLEGEYDKKIKESQKQSGIVIRWEKGLNKKRIATFIFPKEDNEVKLMIGDELIIKYINDNKALYSYMGDIIRINNNEEISVEIKKSLELPKDSNPTYTVELVWKDTSFKRMLRGLTIFHTDSKSISGFLYNLIIGNQVDELRMKCTIPKSLSAPNLPILNTYQLNAVKKALQLPLCLIQGPPGTGKTVTSATIIYHLTKMNYEKILVCAPSNIAVDQLTEMIHKANIKVVRLCAKSRETINSSVDFLTLHEQIKRLDNQEFEVLKKLYKLKEEIGELTEKDESKFRALKRQAEDRILECASVICTTCISSFDRRLKKFRFTRVLIDEATQATEPECLLPMLKGAKHVILVGDHCQLGPVVMCKKAAQARYNQSMFERLVTMGIKPIRLQVQYRMHPSLSYFPSITFYEGCLQNGVSVAERTLNNVNFPWPVSSKPMFFYHSQGKEELSASGTSYLNRTETINIEKIVTFFFKSGLLPHQIGIITPYEGQRSFICSYLQKAGTIKQTLYKGIEVSSVDSFQGREKDIIILSCVRSNEKSGIGFLSDPRRLNVALTRAKYGLVICGNAKSLASDPLWASLLIEFKRQNVLVEGSLRNLKECSLVFKVGKKINMEEKLKPVFVENTEETKEEKNEKN